LGTDGHRVTALMYTRRVVIERDARRDSDSYGKCGMRIILTEL